MLAIAIVVLEGIQIAGLIDELAQKFTRIFTGDDPGMQASKQLPQLGQLVPLPSRQRESVFM